METQNSEKPNWLKVNPSDLEKTVSDLAKEGKTLAEIGMILRDQHGIPKTKLIGKKVSQIAKSAKTNVKTEKEVIKEKVANLNDHIKKHKHDKKAKRSLIKNSWITHKIDLAEKS